MSLARAFGERFPPRLAARSEGFSLIEVMVAMTIMVVVLTATLFTFEQFQATERVANVRNDSQDRLRTALDRMAHDLRNVAGTNPSQTPIDRANAYDFMFVTVDPFGPAGGTNSASLERLRYCLDASTPAKENLWVQRQTWTSSTVPSPPTSNACPDPAWSNQTLYATYLTNEYQNRNRPLFQYTSGVGGVILAVHIDAFVNVNQGVGPPAESHLSTGVFLRNQNQPPVGSFMAQPQSNYSVLLDGSTSSDPEGQQLTYQWYDGTTKVGTGITFLYQAGTGGQHTLSLKVYDPAGLEGDAPPQTVTLYQ